MKEFFIAPGALLALSVVGALFRNPIDWGIESFERLYSGARGSTALLLTWLIALVASAAAIAFDNAPSALRASVVVLAGPLAILATLIRARQRHSPAQPNRLSRVTRGFAVILGAAMIVSSILFGVLDVRAYWGISLAQLVLGVGFLTAGGRGNASHFHRIVLGFGPPREAEPLPEEE